MTMEAIPWMSLCKYTRGVLSPVNWSQLLVDAISARHRALPKFSRHETTCNMAAPANDKEIKIKPLNHSN